MLAMLVAHAALAQDDNDVGAFDFDAADMPDSEFADTASEDPVATGTPDGSDQKADDSKPLPAPSNAVLSIIESDPKQPSELLEAIDLLIRLDRPDYAIQYLRNFPITFWSDCIASLERDCF